jgi:hypothetical protein
LFWLADRGLLELAWGRSKAGRGSAKFRIPQKWERASSIDDDAADDDTPPPKDRARIQSSANLRRSIAARLIQWPGSGNVALGMRRERMDEWS